MDYKDNEVMEIDLMELFWVLWSRLAMLIISAAVVGILSFGYCKLLVPEQFKSTTTIYVLNRSAENVVSYADLQTGTQLTKDYTQIIKCRSVLEGVIKQLNLNTTYEKLSKKVAVSSPADTRMINITVTDHSPYEAQLIANTVRELASAQIMDVMDIDAVNVVDEANLPNRKASPSGAKWLLVGAFLGGFACAAIIIVRYLMDDTIKTAEDVKQYLDLSTLALIPIMEEGDNKTSGSHHRSSRSTSKKSGGKK